MIVYIMINDIKLVYDKHCTDNGDTPLMLATKKGHKEAMKMLLEHPDIKADETNNEGKHNL